MTGVDPTKLFGYNPNSPYAKLFVDIFHLTAPKTDQAEIEKMCVDENMNLVKVVEDEKEEGEIDDNDAAISTELSIKASTKLLELGSSREKTSFSPKARSVSPGCSNGMDIQAQFDLDPNPIRVNWLNNLLKFMAERGTPITFSPIIPTSVSVSTESKVQKQPLDLYSLFHYAKNLASAGRAVGGDINKSMWKAIAARMKVPVQKAFVLRSIYQECLLPFEESQKKTPQPKERKALLPTPGSAAAENGNRSIFHSVQGGEKRNRFSGNRIVMEKGSIKKRLGFKKKGGNFKRGGGGHGQGF